MRKLVTPKSCILILQYNYIKLKMHFDFLKDNINGRKRDREKTILNSRRHNVKSLFCFLLTLQMEI